MNWQMEVIVVVHNTRSKVADAMLKRVVPTIHSNLTPKVIARARPQLAPEIHSTHTPMVICRPNLQGIRE